ncbi:protein neuralized-like [Planococcus citri]|uniref:protein neuralized-like n=1 Tax=Planococcus citri TaxID=170843 RepID=UPI0031F8534B
MGVIGNVCESHYEERLIHNQYSSHNGKCNKSNFLTSVLGPISSKMKGLRKFKKRVSSALKSKSRSDELSHNLPALKFHFTKGKNIKLANDRMLAIRENSFCHGITFTNRPVMVEEKICIKLVDVSDNWKGAIRFGFTNVNPATLKNLPKYACPGLNDRKRFWAKQVNEEYIRKNSILYFYVNEAGVVSYGVNERTKEVLFDGVDVTTKLWAMIDVYGNSTAIQLVNPKLNNTSSDREAGFDLNNSRRSIDSMTTMSYHQGLESRSRLPSLTLNDVPKNVNQERQYRPSTWNCMDPRVSKNYTNSCYTHHRDHINVYQSVSMSSSTICGSHS